MSPLSRKKVYGGEWMDLEKQMVFRTKRLIRARNVVCLRSIFCVCCFPTVGRLKMPFRERF